MKYQLKEVNNNPTLNYLKTLIYKKYYAKFSALRAKYFDLRYQMFKELQDTEKKYIEDLHKSIQNSRKNF